MSRLWARPSTGHMITRHHIDYPSDLFCSGSFGNDPVWLMLILNWHGFTLMHAVPDIISVWNTSLNHRTFVTCQQTQRPELCIHFLDCTVWCFCPALISKSWDLQAFLEYITQLINNQARLRYQVHWLSIIPCAHYSWSTSAYLRNRTPGINIHRHVLQMSAQVTYQGADKSFNVYISYNRQSWIFMEMYLLLGQAGFILVLNEAVMEGNVIECVEEVGLRTSQPGTVVGDKVFHGNWILQL